MDGISEAGMISSRSMNARVQRLEQVPVSGNRNEKRYDYENGDKAQVEKELKAWQVLIDHDPAGSHLLFSILLLSHDGIVHGIH